MSGRMRVNLEHQSVQNLEELSYAQLRESLTKFVMPLTRKERSGHLIKLRTYFQQLPVNIRSTLLEMGNETSQKGSDITKRSDIHLFFLQILYSSRMNYNYKSILYHEHFMVMLNVLEKHADKVNVLRFPSVYPMMRLRDFMVARKTIDQIIIRNSNWLTELGVKGVCTDEMLRVIGQKCDNIQTLDISYSEVTNKGINNLTQIWECSLNKTLPCDEEDIIDDSVLLYQRQMRSSTRMCSCSQVQSHMYKCYKTKLCRSLRIISLNSTHVNDNGILALYQTVKTLQIVYS